MFDIRGSWVENPSSWKARESECDSCHRAVGSSLDAVATKSTCLHRRINLDVHLHLCARVSWVVSHLCAVRRLLVLQTSGLETNADRCLFRGFPGAFSLSLSLTTSLPSRDSDMSEPHECNSRRVARMLVRPLGTSYGVTE